MLQYWSWVEGFEPAFGAGFQTGLALCVLLTGIYNFKIRQHMPWNKKKDEG
tara:strand:- start:93 stop:245 length:153 start_codon:yes stop_codon:yes gene_type:complete